MANWNPWHGCHKISAGCLHCYVYREDARYERDASLVFRTRDFDLPRRKKRDGSYHIPPGSMVWTCFSSDLLLEDADPWREEVWAMMRERSDLRFLFITKRIHRFSQLIPADWGAGYPNVHVCCTVENQQMAEYRLPIFQEAPIRYKSIVCEPLLSAIDLRPWLGPWVQQVQVGGESGPQARICHYDWVKDIAKQCRALEIPFGFRQTGARLCKDGRIYQIPRKLQFSQAKKAGLDTIPAEWRA